MNTIKLPLDQGPQRTRQYALGHGRATTSHDMAQKGKHATHHHLPRFERLSSEGSGWAGGVTRSPNPRAGGTQVGYLV